MKSCFKRPSPCSITIPHIVACMYWSLMSESLPLHDPSYCCSLCLSVSKHLPASLHILALHSQISLFVVHFLTLSLQIRSKLVHPFKISSLLLSVCLCFSFSLSFSFYLSVGLSLSLSLSLSPPPPSSPPPPFSLFLRLSLSLSLTVSFSSLLSKI